ncbi:MAG TPA: phospholipase domain-containing protein, partial [Pedobacter sp.]
NHHPGQDYEITITDHGYKQAAIKKTIAKGATEKLVIDLSSSHGWYDFSIHTTGSFEKRYAGRVETGKLSYTDPVMGS